MLVWRSKGITRFHIGRLLALPVSTLDAHKALPISILDAHKALPVSTSVAPKVSLGCTLFAQKALPDSTSGAQRSLPVSTLDAHKALPDSTSGAQGHYPFPHQTLIRHYLILHRGLLSFSTAVVINFFSDWFRLVLCDNRTYFASENMFHFIAD